MISKTELEALAALARLKLEAGEVESLQKDISNILDYVGQVNAIAAENTVPAAGMVRNVLREDTPNGFPLAGKRDALVRALPREENGYNVVRKIIQKDE